MKCPLNSAIEFINYVRSPYTKDLEELELMATKHGWKTSFEVRKRARENGNTLIITDAHQNIEWVSNYFDTLTGYQSKEVIGKTPRIFQGKETDRSILDKLKANIVKHIPFKGELINYRKEGGLYLCNIEIHPLMNSQNQVVNYVAFEREN
ncbi:MAG: PAS domain-containing protein [Cytophagales bacterium]